MLKKWLLMGAAVAMMVGFLPMLDSSAEACRCAKIYKPVCGTNGKTYSNACLAFCAKVKVRHQGKCKRPCPVYRLIKPKPGCKYIWIMRNGCKTPKLVCKKRCPVYKLAKPKPGCKYIWIMRNGCKVPKLKCKKRCKDYRLAKPRPGCRYVWIKRGRCKVPRLVCNKRRPFCTKLRCKACNRTCVRKKRQCRASVKRRGLRWVNIVRKLCRNSRFARKNRCLCAWAKRRASNRVVLAGMKRCALKKCNKRKCCRKGRKLCIPHAPNVRCVKAPCCKKLVCSPKRCR